MLTQKYKLRTHACGVHINLERDIHLIPRSDGSDAVDRLELNPVEFAKVSPLPVLEDDLGVLLRAGITPQQCNTAGLVGVTDPARLSEIAPDRLSTLANQIERGKAQVAENKQVKPQTEVTNE